jgi:hypothetical protein
MNSLKQKISFVVTGVVAWSGIISAAEIKGGHLNDTKTAIILDVAYGGGCREHTFSLQVDSCLETSPAHCVAKLIEDPHGDACEAFFYRSIEIPLASAGLNQSYYSGANITIKGDRDSSVSFKLPAANSAVLAQPARNTADQSYNFVCNVSENDVFLVMPSSVVLTQTESGKLTENETGKSFRVEFYDHFVSASDASANWSKLGRTILEDVIVQFKSDDASVIFTLYLDEFDHATLYVNGQETGPYHCVKAPRNRD